MAPDDQDPKDDPTVKDLLKGTSLDDVVDEATRKELERWFGLPSFEELEAKGAEPKPEDPEVVAVRERREKAIEAVDRALLEALRVRYEDRSETLLKFEAKLEVRVDPDVAMLDHGMLERVHTVAEPRDFERPEDIEDDLKDVTPQALLRDLHRPETDFSLTFEMIDISAEQRLDIVAEVATAMATSWKLPPLGESPVIESTRDIADARAVRRKPMTELLPQLTNRRVTE